MAARIAFRGASAVRGWGEVGANCRAEARARGKKSGSNSQAPKLGKALADAGVGSRRRCEQLIAEGRVTVNSEIVHNVAERIQVRHDSVSVDGSLVRGKGAHLPPKLYLAVNKPTQYICSSVSNPSVGVSKQNKRVIDLVDSYLNTQQRKRTTKRPPRLFTVGRLDVASEGLILVTNDGAFADKVMHPRNEVVKEYVVTAEAKPTWRQLRNMLNQGAMIEGKRVIPLRCDRVEPMDGGSPNRFVVEVVDGRKHEVRELCAQNGVHVHKLKRVRIGGLKIPPSISNKPGATVELRTHEVKRVTSKSAMNNQESNSYAPVIS